jgi:integrase
MAKVVEPERSNLAISHRPIMRVVHFRDRPRCVPLARKHIGALRRAHPPLPDDEVSGIAASIERYPQNEGLKRKTRRADVRCLADVKALEVEWLWEPYIPLKMITVISGDPGAGKTFLSLALAAALTQGKGMATGSEAASCNVLYLSHENSPEHVTRPRFDALEGDASRFFLLEGTQCDDGTADRITLADLEQLEEAITEHQARLVIIDPLQSYLGGDVDAHRANQTRPIFDGLIRLAEKTGCAMLITRHLSKGLGGSALYRGMGSIDITGAALSELLVAKQPDQEGRIIMAQSKNSLAEFGPSLVYSIGADKKLHWHGESSFKANDLLTALHIVPKWGKHSLSAIKSVEVETWLRNLKKVNGKPASPGTKTKIRNLMSALFAHAIRHEWAARNPITAVRTSAKRLRTPDILTAEELQALLLKLSLRERVMVLIVAITGLRRGELIALRWQDIDFELFQANVTPAVWHNVEGDTKTEASRKPVPLPQFVIEELKHWRSVTLYRADTDYLFPSVAKNGAQPLQPEMILRRHIRPALKQIGVTKRIGFHSFRHGLAVMLRQQGR